jgi:hypothetical protein
LIDFCFHSQALARAKEIIAKISEMNFDAFDEMESKTEEEELEEDM